MTTIDELKIINELLPPDFFPKNITIEAFIDQAYKISEEKTKVLWKKELQKEILKDFEKDLDLLQYRITEITTHHQTNKRKGQLRHIVKETFPSLNIGELQKNLTNAKEEKHS